MLTRRAVLGAAAAGLPLTLLGADARAQAKDRPIPKLPLSITVAEIDGEPVVGSEWLDKRVAEVVRLMSPHGVVMEEVERRRLGELAMIENAEDRNALGDHLQKNVVNAFIVKQLADLEDKGSYIQGVRWRHLRYPSRDYVIVAARSSPTTLTHELGHFFGNGHSKVVNNVMSYDRPDPEKIQFDDRQGATMRRVARSLLARKRVLPVDDLEKA